MTSTFGKLGFITTAFTSKALLHLCSRTKVTNMSRLTQLIRKPRANPLITVSRHLSVFDDPLMWTVLPFNVLSKPSKMRYTLAAEEIMCKNLVTTWYSLNAAKAIPVVRGDGVDQRGVDVALNVLNEELGWVHVFVEGKVNQDEEMLLPIRWGCGKLVSRAQASPIIMPIHIQGFEKMFPEMDEDVQGWRRYLQRFARTGHDVNIDFGEPFHCDELREQYAQVVKNEHENNGAQALARRRQRSIDVDEQRWRPTVSSDAEREIYSNIAARIAANMLELEKKNQ